MEKKSKACLQEKWTKRHNGSGQMIVDFTVKLTQRRNFSYFEIKKDSEKCQMQTQKCDLQHTRALTIKKTFQVPQHIWKRCPAPWLNHSSLCPCTITTDSPTGYCWPIWFNHFKQTFAIPFIITQCSIINAFSLLSTY